MFTHSCNLLTCNFEVLSILSTFSTLGRLQKQAQSNPLSRHQNKANWVHLNICLPNGLILLLFSVLLSST
jgi:hypothetical protein